MCFQRVLCDIGTCKVILAYSPYGDLLSHVRRHANSLSDASDSGDGRMSDSRIRLKMPLARLCYFCEQIATGMEFLASKDVRCELSQLSKRIE